MTKEYSISGMTCAACVHNVEALLKSIDGIERVDVNLLLHTALVESKEEVQVDLINQNLKDFGYTASVKVKLYEEQIPIWKVIFSLILSGITMSLSMLFMHKLWSQVAQLFCCILCLIIPCRHYFILGFKKLGKKILDMDTLISLGASISFAFSLFNVFFEVMIQGHTHSMKLYFESACIIPSFVMLGKWIEERAKAKSSKELIHVLKINELSWEVLRAGETKTIRSMNLQKDDIIELVQGKSVPADSIILEGNVTADLSLLNGESRPHEFTIEDTLLSGTQIVSGIAKVKVLRDGAFSHLANMMRNVEHTKYQKSKSEKFAEKWVRYFVPFVLISSLFFSILIWILTKNIAFAFETGVSVLVVACPCALGLAVPTAIAAGLGACYRRGIMVRNPDVFEKMGQAKQLILDKTGTLTSNKVTIQEVELSPVKFSGTELKELNSVINKSTHPLCVSYSEGKSFLSAEIPKKWNEIPGQGIIAETKVGSWIIGSANFLTAHGIDVSKLSVNVHQSYFLIALNDELKQIIYFTHQIKSGAEYFIKRWAERGFNLHLVSGDDPLVVKTVATQLGIKKFKGKCSPQEKQDYIKELQDKNEKVIMLGDGLNDAQAIAAADIGVSIGNQSEMINYSSDIVIHSHEIKQFDYMLSILTFTDSILKQNIFWAFAYNILMIPLAGGIWFLLFDQSFSPMAASVCMVVSSVSVVFNTLRISVKNYDSN